MRNKLEIIEGIIKEAIEHYLERGDKNPVSSAVALICYAGFHLAKSQNLNPYEIGACLQETYNVPSEAVDQVAKFVENLLAGQGIDRH